MVTAVDLERMLDEKKQQIVGLAKRREEVQKELDAIDLEIQELIGDGRGLGSLSRSGKRRRRRRIQNERSLRVVVLEILGKTKAGLTLANLAEKVEASGYKSTSRNFRNVLYQCVYNTSGIEFDSDRSCYRLSK